MHHLQSPDPRSLLLGHKLASDFQDDDLGKAQGFVMALVLAYSVDWLVQSPILKAFREFKDRPNFVVT